MRRTIVLLTTMALTVLVASGVALAVNKVGTDGPDTLTGTNGNDNLDGRGGQDNIFSLDGTDNLAGGLGKDNVVAGDERRLVRGDKNLDGGPGNDAVLGGKGSDNIVGGEGNDWLFGMLLTRILQRHALWWFRQRRDRRLAQTCCSEGCSCMRLRLRPSDRRQGHSGRPRLREGGSRPRVQRECF